MLVAVIIRNATILIYWATHNQRLRKVIIPIVRDDTIVVNLKYSLISPSITSTEQSSSRDLLIDAYWWGKDPYGMTSRCLLVHEFHCIVLNSSRRDFYHVEMYEVKGKYAV